MAFNHHFFLLNGQGLTCSDTQLFFDQVNAAAGTFRAASLSATACSLISRIISGQLCHR
jgi:hypothetical protein